MGLEDFTATAIAAADVRAAARARCRRRVARAHLAAQLHPQRLLRGAAGGGPRRRRSRGRSGGGRRRSRPLAGVPVAIKDVIWERGIEATDGSRSLLGFVPGESATVVTRLLRAGAIVVGRTNQPEFCYRGISENELYGRTSNPWDVGRVPGGSSGGSAAAVAAGLVPLAIGTDGGGSIRIPASFCGVAGIKPTYGLVPREPQWPGWYTLTTSARSRSPSRTPPSCCR